MHAFLRQYPERRLRNLSWLGVAAALIVLAAIVYQWLGPCFAKASSPSPLELFDREGQRRRGIRHAAELDHEVCRGRSIRGFEDHDRIRFAEEPEKLVDHHVVRKFGLFEQSGRLLPLAGEDPQLHQEEHGVTGGASRAHDITVPRRLSSACGGCVEGMFPDVTEMRLSE